MAHLCVGVSRPRRRAVRMVASISARLGFASTFPPCLLCRRRSHGRDGGHDCLRTVGMVLYCVYQLVDVGNAARYGWIYHWISVSLSVIGWLFVINLSGYFRDTGRRAAKSCRKRARSSRATYGGAPARQHRHRRLSLLRCGCRIPRAPRGSRDVPGQTLRKTPAPRLLRLRKPPRGVHGRITHRQTFKECRITLPRA